MEYDWAETWAAIWEQSNAGGAGPAHRIVVGVSMNRLLHSSKFLAVIIDVVLSLVIYFISKYLAPSIAEDVLFVIGALNAVFAVFIGAVALEDAAEKRAGGRPGP